MKLSYVQVWQTETDRQTGHGRDPHEPISRQGTRVGWQREGTALGLEPPLHGKAVHICVRDSRDSFLQVRDPHLQAPDSKWFTTAKSHPSGARDHRRSPESAGGTRSVIRPPGAQSQAKAHVLFKKHTPNANC